MSLEYTISKLLAPTLIAATAQKLTVGATHTESSAVGSTTVLILASTDTHVQIGSAPVATTSDFLLLAKVPLLLSCKSTDKLSCLQDSAGGFLWLVATS